MEALLAAQPVRGIRGVLQMLAEYSETAHLVQFFDKHDRPRPRLGRRGRRGQQRQAFGRSRGGSRPKSTSRRISTGRPLDFHLAGGQASDSAEFETSLDIGRTSARASR